MKIAWDVYRFLVIVWILIVIGLGIGATREQLYTGLDMPFFTMLLIWIGVGGLGLFVGIGIILVVIQRWLR